MRSRNLIIVYSIALLTTLASAAQYPSAALVKDVEQGASISTGIFAGWQQMKSADFDGHKIIWGQPVPTVNSALPDDLARSVAIELGLTSQFRLLARNITPTREYLIFREYRDNLPVVSGRLNIAQNRSGEFSRISCTSYDKWPTEGTQSLTPFVAASYLTTSLEPANWQVVTDKTFTCWYPDVTHHVLRAAYWINVAGSRPHQRHVGIVDAQTGEVLLDWSGISEETLNLAVDLPFWQPYDHSETQIAPCRYLDVSVNGADLNTNFDGTISIEAGNHADVVASLSGLYVVTSNDDDGETALNAEAYQSPFGNPTMHWTEDMCTRPELNLYYHTEFIHDWYKVLDPPYDALDYPMPAVANYGGAYDNAFWNGFGTYYGAGMNYGNFGMYSDVIYHEYTHGVTDGIYPDDMLPYVDQPGAMNEAWSDYFACTINGDPLMAEWLTGNPHSSFRDLESNMVFPRNWVGEVHGDSPFISAPLWQIRRELGAAYADSIAHFARYGLSELFLDYFIDVLEADDIDGDVSNGTPNDEVIYTAFGEHGIGPGSRPNYVMHNLVINDAVGNGNGFAEAGETITINFTLINDVILFPPSATDVLLHASTTDGSLSLMNAEIPLGTIGPRDTVQVGPININVAEGTSDHWGVVSLTLTSEQFTEPIEFPLEFTIGIPKIRVVTRSLTTSVDKYVTGTIRDMDKIFVLNRLNDTEALNLAALPDTGMVLWLSGDAATCGLTTGDIDALTSFISGGGRLTMSGKNILDGIAGTDFANDILGVGIAGRTQIRMTSVLNSPFVQGDTYLLTGSGGAANQDTMTVLQPMTNSTSVLRYGPVGQNSAGVSGPINGRTLVFGFGIEAVADNSPIGNESRFNFLDHVLVWAGHPSPVNDREAPISQPDDFSLRAAYPNPFNSSVRIDYSIGNNQNSRLVIYDVLGREVQSTNLSVQSTSYTWQPSISSGVYFAVLKSDTRTSSPQKLLLLR